MAHILVAGSPELAAEISTLFRPEHSWRMLDVSDAGDSATDVPPARSDRQPQVDAIFDLTIGDHEARRDSLVAARRAAGPATVIFSNVATTSATAAASLIGARNPVVGVAMVPALTASATSVEASLPLQADSTESARAVALLESILTKPVLVVEDRIGLVSARILSMVINEAAFALQEGVADAPAIDTAMKLGTGYPEGPLRWVDAIGAGVVVSILDALYAEYGEERYRASVLLRQYALAGRAFHDATA